MNNINMNDIHNSNINENKNSNINYYDELVKYSENNSSDISQHLPVIFKKTLFNLFLNDINLIVELGVCSGQSTKVFDYINRIKQSNLISIDIEECNYENVHNGRFIKCDDIEFADEFINYCNTNNLQSKIDVLFIDTSHYYEHTKQEIEKWFPFLNDDAFIIFHDTNMPGVYKKDNSYYQTWDNQRGVIKAIQEYFDLYFFEERPFHAYNLYKDNSFWNIEHYPESNGITYITKSGKLFVNKFT